MQIDESIWPFVSIMLVGCMAAFGAIVIKYYRKNRGIKTEDSKPEQKKD